MHIVYRTMDQAELDRQYNARATVTDFDAEMARYRNLSDRAYADCDVQRDLAYGPHPQEQVDIFPAGDDTPVFIFLHGGYWRFLGRPDSAFMAESFVEKGVAVAVVEYTLAPLATLDQIVDQIRRAIAFIWHEAERFGINRNRLFVGGSSAGAHLAAMAATTDWPGQFSMPEKTIKGALLASGLFDLEPVRLSAPNAWLKLDKAAARRNSPVHHPAQPDVRFHLAWGGSETDEFKRQSIDYANHLSNRGHPVSCAEAQDRNHFDIITDLADPRRDLFRDTMGMITSQIA